MMTHHRNLLTGITGVLVLKTHPNLFTGITGHWY